MAILIDLPENTERLLRQRAVQQGQDISEFARAVLERELHGTNGIPVKSPEKLTPEEWLAKFEAWVKMPRRNLPVDFDDSRESIYAGCGE